MLAGQSTYARCYLFFQPMLELRLVLMGIQKADRGILRTIENKKVHAATHDTILLKSIIWRVKEVHTGSFFCWGQVYKDTDQYSIKFFPVLLWSFYNIYICNNFQIIVSKKLSATLEYDITLLRQHRFSILKSWQIYFKIKTELIFEALDSFGNVFWVKAPSQLRGSSLW